MRTIQGSPGAPLQRARAASSISNAFTAPAPTATKPSGAGVLDFSIAPPAWLRVFPFGAGVDNSTLTVRLIGWSLVGALWVPSVLCQFDATLSTAVGVSGSDVTDTERFADTVADPTIGAAGVTCQPYSPANNIPGFMLLDACGCTLFQLDTSVGTATSGNALVGPA